MKILQVAGSLHDWGGIERYVAYLSGGLIERGHEVVVACPPGSPLAARVANSSPVAMRRKLDLRGFVAYRRLVRSQPFDVVHAHFSPDFVLASLAARGGSHALRVMTRHVAVRWNPAKARMYARLWQKIVPVSHAVERRLVNSGVPPGQLTVAKAGAPMPAVSRGRSLARSDLGLARTDFALGSFGRLAAEKGINILLDAALLMPEVRVCVFGDGPESASLRGRAGPNVTFHGRISEVGDAMSAMDTVVIPSVWEESFPYAALEAMALARPILASDIGGLPEMVTDGVTGRLFPPGDAPALAAAAESLRGDPGGRLAMSQAATDRYLAEFTVEHMVDRMLAVYADSQDCTASRTART